MKTEKRNDDRYPYEVIIDYDSIIDGKRLLIPQQKEFGTYTKLHGCSVTACSIALQWIGIDQEDKTIWNPSEIYNKAKKDVSGYNGSKLSIWGCKEIINKIAGREVAFWHSNDGKHDTNIRANIDKQLKKGNIILFEEKDPVHTIVILGIDTKNRYIVATNGRVVRRSKAGEIQKALHGLRGVKNQKNWWGGREHGAGYVVVKG